MAGTPNPVEQISGLTGVSAVVKAQLIAWAKANVIQVLADATDLRARSMSGQSVLALKSNGRLYFSNSLDGTTADDGQQYIRDFDGLLFQLGVITGLDGANGTDPGIRWKFDSSITMADPGAGDVRFNNATLASITALSISASSGETGNPSVANFVKAWDDSSTLGHRGYLIIKKVSAPQNFIIFDITAALTDNSTWMQLTVAHVASAGSFANTDTLSVQFFRTGDQGGAGADGTSLLSRVRVVATTNIPIGNSPSAGLENGDTVDSVTLATGDDVLLTNQSAPAENGIYTVVASGVASRKTAFNTYNSMPGVVISVMAGTINRDTLWHCTSDLGGTLGTTAILFNKVGNEYFNVKDFGAVGNFIADDTVAIQAACDAAHAIGPGSGVVFFPPGNYKVTTKVSVPAGVWLMGSGIDCCIVNSSSADIICVEFVGNGKMTDIFCAGKQSAGTQPTVLINAGFRVYLHDCNLWGGLYGLQNKGIDSYIDNCFIAAMSSTGSHLYSNGGSNWYHRCKFDDVGVTVANGIKIDLGAASGAMENEFFMCDASGAFTNASVLIDDGDKTHAVTLFSGLVASSAIKLTNASMTTLSACRLGAQVTVSNNSPTIVNGCHSLISQTIAGTATVKSGNSANIS